MALDGGSAEGQGPTDFTRPARPEFREELKNYTLTEMLGAAAVGTGKVAGDTQAASSAYSTLLSCGDRWTADPTDPRGAVLKEYASRLFEVMHFTPADTPPSMPGETQ